MRLGYRERERKESVWEPGEYSIGGNELEEVDEGKQGVRMLEADTL